MAMHDKNASLRCDDCGWSLNDREFAFLVQVLMAYRDPHQLRPSGSASDVQQLNPAIPQ